LIESELLARCRQGDREAQRELYARTSERIYRLLVRMTGSDDTALDLAQDTYLRAFTRIAQFDGRSSLATWLYRIAVTQALQFLRRERQLRAKLHERTSQTPIDTSGEQAIARLDLNEALAALQPTDRVILLLRYQEGLDYRAIAKVVECAEGTVASRLHRARERLRKILGTSYAPPEESGPAAHQRDRDIGPAGPRSVAGKPASRGSTRK
jgi:RNA polymerase sigma-70 factor (ECF subfamily)